jgi:anti-sigma regulatory factor (Ser/Thr protein kinase)
VPAAESTFTADERQVSFARRFVVQALQEWGAERFEWAATALVSEMATNAVLHARTGFTVSLRLVDDVLRIAVADMSSRLPQQRVYGVEAATGRGLVLMDDLSDAHGVDASPDGKSVWCELRVGGSATERLEEETDLAGLLEAFSDDLPDVQPQHRNADGPAGQRGLRDLAA